MSNAVDDILSSLDFDQLAQYVGADPAEVEQAASAALPALFGGLQANAQDPSGASSILSALGQHDPSVLDGGVDVSQVDTQDGEAIAQHIFGQNTDAVYNQLGQYSAAGGLGGSLFRKLIPILAPLVLSYVMKQMTQRTGGSGGSGSGGGGLGDILGQVLGGGSGQKQQSSGGGGLGDILGQVLGGGAGQSTSTRSGGSYQQEEPSGPLIPTDGSGPADQGSQQDAQSGSASDPMGGILGDILGQVLGGGATQSSQRSSAPSAGSIITDVLGGLLGGGRR